MFNWVQNTPSFTLHCIKSEIWYGKKMLMQKGKNPNYIIFYYNGNQFPNSVVKYFRKITEINKG